jgi:hypothetical protein
MSLNEFVQKPKYNYIVTYKSNKLFI